MKTCSRCGRPVSHSGAVGISGSDLQGGKNMDQQKNTFDPEYWKSTAGDCDKIRQAVESNAKLDEDFCKSKGFESCPEMYHSCISTVVCQVFNYIYFKGMFAQQCGKYGPKVAKALWIVWRNFFEAFESPSCFFGFEVGGDCWPVVLSMQEQYLKLWTEAVNLLEQQYRAMRYDAGLPPGSLCLDLDVLKTAVLTARREGIVPKPRPEMLKKPDLKPGGVGEGPGGFGSVGGPDIGSSAQGDATSDTASGSGAKWSAVQDESGCSVARGMGSTSQHISIHEALIEFSMWSDIRGFHVQAPGPQYFFYNKNNWVQAVSNGCTSRLQLLKEEELENGTPSPPTVTPGYYHPTVSQIQKAVFPVTAYDMTMAAGKHPFNVWIHGKGKPDKCTSEEADGVWDDIGACVNTTEPVLQYRLDALKRVVPWILGIMVAQVERDKLKAQEAATDTGSTGATVMKAAVGTGIAAGVGWAIWKWVLPKFL